MGSLQSPLKLVSARNVDPRQYAPVLGYMLAPVIATGYAMAAWRFAADVKWLGEFFISDGLLSRWQVWLAIAVATQALAHQLNRARRPDDRIVS